MTYDQLDGLVQLKIQQFLRTAIPAIYAKFLLCLSFFSVRLGHLHLAIWLKQRWPEGCQVVVRITFSHAWFGDNGRVEHEQGIHMWFNGISLTRLGNEIENRLGNGVQIENMTLCVQAGNLGRAIPLFTDLPLGDENHISSDR